jgi:hypothetical protein
MKRAFVLCNMSGIVFCRAAVERITLTSNWAKHRWLIQLRVNGFGYPLIWILRVQVPDVVVCLMNKCTFLCILFVGY